MLSQIRMTSCCLSCLYCLSCLSCRYCCFLHLNCQKSCYYFYQRKMNFFRKRMSFSKESLCSLWKSRIVNCLHGMIPLKLSFFCTSLLFFGQCFCSCFHNFRLNLHLPLKKDGGRLFRVSLFVQLNVVQLNGLD